MIDRNSVSAIWLSHPWGPSAPAYGNGDKITFIAQSDLGRGDTSNSLKFTASNHIGTHMDAPRHFIMEGRTVDSYSPSELTFTCPFLFEPKLADNERHVNSHHFERMNTKELASLKNCDLLLIRTSAESYRHCEKYWRDGPGLGPTLANFLRDNAPTCRAVGIDSISITAYSNRALGRQVHREFLGGTRPFFLIEDMALADAKSLKSVFIAPLRIELGDGAPVTVMGFEA